MIRLSRRHDDLVVLAEHVEARHLAAQALGHELELRALRRQMERVEHEELLAGCPRW